jgi:hypothetical protein
MTGGGAIFLLALVGGGMRPGGFAGIIGLLFTGGSLTWIVFSNMGAGSSFLATTTSGMLGVKTSSLLIL